MPALTVGMLVVAIERRFLRMIYFYTPVMMSLARLVFLPLPKHIDTVDMGYV